MTEDWKARAEKAEAQARRLREALRPFASPKLTTDEDGDELTMTDAQGRFCIPDGHGYQIVWADEGDGDRVQLTAGQLRRARAVLDIAPDIGENTKDATDEL